MKRLARWVVAGAFLISASILAACGGGGGTPKITISSGGIMAIDQGQTLTFTATITNTNNGDTVAWTITSGPGTLAGATSTSAMYTAPASVNASTSVTITVTVSSSKGTVATQTITFMITPPPSLGPGGNLAAGTEGTAYSQSPTVTGGAGTLTWAVQANPNPLPAGLSINSNTGAITGTPTGPAGSSTFTVQLTDSGNPKITISAQFTILINNYQVPTLAPVSGALPAGIEGTTYANQTFTVSGGHAPFTFSIMNGSLPAGLTESSSNNMLVVSGKPAGPPCNPCTFSVKVVDSSNPAQTVTNNYSVVISLPPPPSITTASLPVGVEGAAYSQTLAATAGLAPYSFTVTTGTLPAGLSLNGSTGLISGTPTGPNGTASFTITVTDHSNPPQTGTKNLGITVNLPAAPAISPTSLPNGNVGTSYSQTLTVSGGLAPFTWLISPGTLPVGLSLTGNNTTATISGTPTTAQNSVTFTGKVTDSSNPPQTGTQAYTVTINPPAPPVIKTTPAQLPSATVGSVYNFTLQGSGYGTLTWSTTPALSDGLSLNPATGAITGTPISATTLNFSVTLTDGVGQQTTVTGFSLVVSTESVAFTPSAPASVTAGGTLSVNAIVSNDAGNGGVDWTVSCGGSPCGSFTASHTASGTATTFDAPASVPTGGTVTITATAHDAPNPQVSAVVTVNYQAIAISPSSGSLPGGTVSTAYNTTINASGGLPPYTFSLDASSASLPAGLTFNAGPPATITGTPTTTGTTTGIIIDVKDSETTPMTAQMTYSITVNSASAGCTGMPTGHESTLSGHYAFLFQGWKGTGAGSPTAGVVSFDADATGKILGGEADVNRAAGAQNITLNSTSSDATTLYTVGEDPVASAGDIGCVVLTSSGSSGGSLKFVFGLGKKNGSGVYTKGRIIRFDDSTGSGTRGSGVMMLQDTTAFSGGNTAQLAAHFAFGLDGVDFTGGHFGIAGSLTLAPSTGALSNLTFDANDAGSLQPDVTGGTGSITSVSATTGRALLSLTAGGGTSHEAIYIVNANEFFVVQTDTFSGSPNSNPIISGRAIATGSSFSQSSLSGNYIIHLTGIDTGFSPAEADVTLGLLTFSGGTLNGTLYQYEAGNVSSPQTLSGGSYSISSPSGRTTVTNVGNHLPVLYLAAPTSNTEPISAFFVGTDTSAIFGFAEASSGTFTTAGLAGNYFFGTEDPGDNTVQDEAGVVLVQTSGSCNGTQEASGQSGLSSGAISGGGGSCAFTITNSNGTGNLGANTVALTNGTSIFFIDEGGSGTSPAKITVVEKQ